MSLIDQIALAVAVLTMGAQVFMRSHLGPYIKKVFFLSVAVVFGLLVYQSVLQYLAWHTYNISKGLLPPYRGIDYFLSYVGSRLFAPWGLTLVAALAIPIILKRINKKYGERFFHNEEFGLMRLGIFLVGWPGFLFYIPLILLSGVGFSAVYGMLGRGRMPFYYLWIPTAISVMLLIVFFIPADFLKSFNV